MAEITAQIILPPMYGVTGKAADEVQLKVCKSTDAPPREITKDIKGRVAVRQDLSAVVISKIPPDIKAASPALMPKKHKTSEINAIMPIFFNRERITAKKTTKPQRFKIVKTEDLTASGTDGE